MAEIRKRILCIEENRATASSLSQELVARGFDVCVAHNDQEDLGATLKWVPDLVLCNIGMLAMSGFQILERLTAIAPRFGQMPFIFLAPLTDRNTEPKGPHLGASGDTITSIDFDMLTAIIAARLAVVERRETQPEGEALNERELQTLTWAARGKTSAEIAQLLRLSKRTVDFHIDNARTKLGTITRIEAIIKAMSRGLIEP